MKHKPRGKAAAPEEPPEIQVPVLERIADHLGDFVWYIKKQTGLQTKMLLTLEALVEVQAPGALEHARAAKEAMRRAEAENEEAAEKAAAENAERMRKDRDDRGEGSSKGKKGKRSRDQ